MSKLTKITRDDKFVEYKHEAIGPKGSAEESAVKSPDIPLKSFDTALQKLNETVGRVLGLPAKWASECTVTAVAFSYTKRGTRSAQIWFRRELKSTTREHRMSTPVFQFDKAAEGEDGRPECNDDDAKAIKKVIRETERYIDGERQQGLLPLEDPASEPQGGQEQEQAAK